MKNKMTVEEFLAAGHKFVVGDTFESFGKAFTVGDDMRVTDANRPCAWNCYRFVISAKALDKPKHTKVTYEEVSFDKLSDAFLEHEKAPLHVHNCGYHKANGMAIYEAVTNNGVYGLYRKVESEITPMQAAKDACEEFMNEDRMIDFSSDFGSLCDAFQDSGDVEWEEEFISVCRAMVDAYDGK